MESTINKQISVWLNDPLHRYKSWEHCFQAFGNENLIEREYLTLHLAFYLASWGMYRGSSGLLQKNHLLHDGAVDILLEDKYRKLRCSRSHEVGKDDIDTIIALKNDLKKYYNKHSYLKENESTAKNLSATDTLISKIILGTLGCVPAYDRYFIKGFTDKDKGIENKRRSIHFDEQSLTTAFDFIQRQIEQISRIQKYIAEKNNGLHYSAMKIVDMYCWQVGFEAEIANAKNKKTSKLPTSI